jgi:hypothetical protein
MDKMVRKSAVTPLKSSTPTETTCTSSILKTNGAGMLRSDPPKKFPSISEDSLMEKSVCSSTAHLAKQQHSAAEKATSSDSRSTQCPSEPTATTSTLTPLSSDNNVALLRSQLEATTAQPQISESIPQKTSLFAGQSALLEASSTQGPNLSLGDMFETDEPTDLMNQNEYFENDDGTPSDVLTLEQKDCDTPPTSINNTPNGIFSKPPPAESPLFLDAPGALKIQLPPPGFQPTGSSPSHVANSMASSTESSVTAHRPVLYSAIGSLEDPSTNSYGRWNKRPVSKYDFPSSRLIPPANQTKIGGYTSPAVFNTSKTPKSRNSRNTDAAQKRGNSKQGASEAGLQQRVPNVGSTGDLAGELSSSSSALDKKPSNLRASTSGSSSKTEDEKGNKKVTITEENSKPKPRRIRNKKGPAEMFRPSSDAYTPRMGKKQIKYKPAEMRTPVQQMASPLGTLSRPNFRDALRRVAMIIRQHIIKIERRFESKTLRHDDGLFLESMRTSFSEEAFVTPTYKCTMVRVPMARGGMVYGLKKVRRKYEIPTEAEIYDFGHQLFKTVQLSSECSIVCLIYIERLMEVAKVPLMSDTWRPIVMCGLLLASKVWQDLSSWNIEFASVYPQYPLDAINRLELHFLRSVKWDLYISSSQYAKYYFALRSLVEKSDFRQRYNRMVGGVDSVQADEALKIQKRSSMVKEEALLQLSRSM